MIVPDNFQYYSLILEREKSKLTSISTIIIPKDHRAVGYYVFPRKASC